MGVDIQTYRAKIGTYRHSFGIDVVTQVVVINFCKGLKYVGCVLFIGMLLIMAGVEQNPGPRNYDNAQVNEPLETTKIKITEVSQNITKNDIELFFQEQGWGEIKEVTDDTIDKSVIIEFVDAKAVDAVLQQLPICIAGTTITVERVDDRCDPDECKFDPDSLQSDEAGVENIPSTKIRVTGLPKGATNEVLIMFFENEKRQGGGRVKDVILFDEGNSAIVDFEDASAVDKVMQNKPIKILGHQVNVKVFVADDSTSNARPTKIEVIGLPKGITDEILTMFFENEHRQGGGPVKSVTIDDDIHVGVVEFEEPEAVETVMQKQPIVICDTLVKIQIIRQQQLETEDVIKTIKVSGLPKTVTDEILLMFFENEKRQGGGKVTEIRLNKEEDSALVEFEDEKAVRIVLEKQPIQIQGHQVRVEKYIPARMENTKICVTGLPDTITDEVLIMFFENENRQGGGKVVEVVMDKAKRYAIIEFETPTAVIKVLQNRPISIFGTEINVDTYALPSRHTPVVTLTHDNQKRSGQISSPVTDREQPDTQIAQQQEIAVSGTVNTQTRVLSLRQRFESIAKDDERRSGQISSIVKSSKKTLGKYESDTQMSQQKQNAESGAAKNTVQVSIEQQPTVNTGKPSDDKKLTCATDLTIQGESHDCKTGKLNDLQQQENKDVQKCQCTHISGQPEHFSGDITDKTREKLYSTETSSQYDRPRSNSKKPPVPGQCTPISGQPEHFSGDITNKTREKLYSTETSSQYDRPRSNSKKPPVPAKKPVRVSVEQQRSVYTGGQSGDKMRTGVTDLTIQGDSHDYKTGKLNDLQQQENKDVQKGKCTAKPGQVEYLSKYITAGTRAESDTTQTSLVLHSERSEPKTTSVPGKCTAKPGQVKHLSRYITPGTRAESDTTKTSWLLHSERSEPKTTSMPDNKVSKHTETFLEKLGLSSYTTRSITIKDMITIDPYENTANAHMKKLPWILLRRLLSVNSDAMDLRLKHDQQYSNAKRTKRSVYDLFHSTNEREDISPLDVFLLVFQCCDPMLKQLLFQKLFLCKMAVPFIYREHSNLQSILSIWPFRSLVIESKNKSGGNETFEILDMPTKVVTFARFGRPLFSKSKLLNRILSETIADTFFNRDCPLGTTKRIVTDGYIEMFWLPSIGDTRCRFADTVTFLNMRGDIGNSFQEKECALTAALTDIVVIVCDLNSVIEKCKELQKSLMRFSSVVLIIANPIDQNDRSVQIQLVEFADKFPKENMKEMQIICTHDGLHERSATDLLTDVTDVISDCLKIIPNKSKSLQERLQNVGENLLKSDENGTCKYAKEMALSVIQKMERESTQENWFNYITPVQSLSSPYLSDLLKQIHIEKDITEYNNIKQHLADQRYKQTGHTSESMQTLMTCIIKFADSPCFLQYFINWLKYYLDHKKRRILPDLMKKNQLAWNTYWKMKNESKCNPKELEKLESNIKHLESQIDKASFGIENLLREIYHICDSILVLNKDRVISLVYVFSLADAVASMVCNGQVIELLDGNSFYMPTEWIKLVLNKVHTTIGQKRVLTLSVLGLQSSGKSTMLNTMFGIQFSTSSGRCTRGIHMQMIPLIQTKNMQQRAFDFVLVIDTEGLRAPELSNKNLQRDNELATIITGIGDVTILNVMGENMSELQDILQILIHAFLRLKMANERLEVGNSCYFVHQNVTDISASENTKTGLQLSIKHLDSVTEESALSEGISNITTFSHVIEFDTEQNVWHLPNLWQGNPPVARVNRKYSEAVVDICHTLIRKALGKTGKSYKSLNDICVHTEDLWKGILAEDFVFSFRNSLEKRAYVELETKFKNEIWALEKNIDDTFYEEAQKHYSQSDSRESLVKARSILIKEINNKVATEESSVTEKMISFFKNNNFKDTTIQWKQHTMNQIRIFCTEIISKKTEEIDIISNKRAVDIMTNSMHAVHEEHLRKQTIKLANELKGKSMTKTEINKRFENIWDTFVNDSFKSDYKKSQSTLGHYFMDYLTDMYHSGAVLNDILQRKPLNDRTFNILKLSGSFQHTEISEHDVSVKSKIRKISDKVNKFFSRGLKTCFTIARNRLETTFETIDFDIRQLCMDDKEITGRDIKSFLRNVHDAVEQINEPADEFTLQVSFKIKTMAFVSRVALSCFERNNKEFNKVHGVEVRLEKYKQQVKDRFDAHLAGCKVEDTAARLFRRSFEDFCYEAVKDRLPSMIKHYLKSHFAAVKYHLIIDILTDLANENQFEDWVHYIMKPNNFAYKWVTDKSEHLLFETSKGRYYELAADEVNNHIEEVISSIKQCERRSGNSPLTIDIWMRDFLSNLKTYKFPRECFRDVVRELEPVGSIHIDNFTTVLLQNLKTSGETITSKFKMVNRQTVKWTTFNPYKELCETIWGCPEECIFCGEPCTKCYIHSGSSHSCIQHRPSGCKGTHNKETRKISLTSCNFKVVSDRTGTCSVFNYLCNKPKREECSIEKHPYKMYREYLPDWDIEPTNDMEFRSKFWMWFMATYKQELSSRYDVDVSDVPESWGDITKEDACESLRNIYK